jgi:diguanylate cyclase (GGDEF)-like protein
MTSAPLFASSDDESLESVLHSIGDAVCVTDRNLVFVGANRLMAAFYGIADPRDLLGKSAFEVYPNFKKSVFYDTCQRTLDTGETNHSFGFSSNLDNWVVIRCYRSREDRYVMVVHRSPEGTVKAEYTTSKDPLTALPNRFVFEQDALNLQSLGQERLSLTLLDISHFKHLNESIGFDAGNKCLMEVAARIKQAALATDRVYRAGNDQFLVLGRSGDDILERRRDSLREALAQPLTLGEAQYVLQFHVGTHTAEPGETPNQALAKTERALFHAKSRRLAEVAYSPAIAQTPYDPGLTKAIQDGLRQREFELFFQPQLDALDERPWGAEALIRWRHPERGLVFPDQFLPFAEDTGLIESLDRYVVREAFEQAARWQREGRSLVVGVNLSAQSICNPDLVAHFRTCLAETGVDPRTIALEITETSLVKDVAISQQVIGTLKDMGFDIGIDDFGTGQASMLYLARYPSNTLKIDRSFVRFMDTDPALSTMVHNIINMAHGLGIKVVAEGVETAGELALLQRLGCDLVQGYYFAKPLPRAAFEAWLDTREPGRLGSDIR